MKRLCGILLALAGLFLYAPCAAQNTRVRGTVTDAQTGEPIPYAVVLFPGTTTGITTDDEGFYSARKPRHVELHPGGNGQL